MNTIESYLCRLTGPVFLVSAIGESNLYDLLYRVVAERSSGTVARACRGHKMRRVEDLFDEFAAAFQFPYYFGENWAAFDECIADLSWLPGRSYLTCITRAEQLLADDAAADFETLTCTLQGAAAGLGGADPNLAVMGREPSPFHVLLQVLPGNEESMRNRIQASRGSVEVVNPA